MDTNQRALTLLQVAVPPSTVLTVPSMVRALEAVGVLAGPETIQTVDLVASLVPPDAPATIANLISVLGNAIKHHPRATKAHHEALAKLLKTLEGMQDAVLTFGTFLPLCETLVKAPPVKMGKPA